MPKENGTVRVQTIAHETMRFRVESWSHPQRPHIVDLLANAGRGECSCTDWQTRRGPAIRAGASHGKPETMCRHVKVARTYFLNKLLKQMAADYGRGITPIP